MAPKVFSQSDIDVTKSLVALGLRGPYFASRTQFQIGSQSMQHRTELAMRPEMRDLKNGPKTREIRLGSTLTWCRSFHLATASGNFPFLHANQLFTKSDDL
jgi:hypothetical protein